MTTAAEILTASIEDIDAGRWVCNTLIENETAYDEGMKPMGCALGLVGINSGAAYLRENHNGQSFWLMSYPDECEAAGDEPWSNEAWDAIDALAMTAELPESYTKYNDGDPTLRITAFNDGGYELDDEDEGAPLTAEQAKAWFERAKTQLA